MALEAIDEWNPVGEEVVDGLADDWGRELVERVFEGLKVDKQRFEGIFRQSSFDFFIDIENILAFVEMLDKCDSQEDFLGCVSFCDGEFESDDYHVCSDCMIEYLFLVKMFGSFELDYEVLFGLCMKRSSDEYKKGFAADLVFYLDQWVDEFSDLEKAFDLFREAYGDVYDEDMIVVIENYEKCCEVFGDRFERFYEEWFAGLKKNFGRLNRLAHVCEGVIPGLDMGFYGGESREESCVVDGISVEEDLDGDYGTCGKMYKYHKATFLGDSKEELVGRVVLLYVAGELVGSLKLKGDKTMMGVRNVFNSEGELVIKKGIVYKLSKTVIDQCCEVAEGGGAEKWLELELEELKVSALKSLVAERDSVQGLMEAIGVRVGEILGWRSGGFGEE